MRARRAKLGEHEVEDLAADIVEVDVDAVRTVRAQAFAYVLGLVVDGGVESEFVDKVVGIWPGRRRGRLHGSP
jgi:hypothetical protein